MIQSSKKCLILFSLGALVQGTFAWVSTSSNSLIKQQKSSALFMGYNSNKRRIEPMVDFMENDMESTVGDASDVEIHDDDKTIDLVHTIVKAADGRKADNIVAMLVAPVTTVTSYMIILSGNSRPQNQAIAAAIRDDVMEQFDGMRPSGNGVPEGSAESGWMLIDYGSVMVHIMTPKSRLYYNVEGQWKDKGGQYVDISNILVPNVPPGMPVASTSDDETTTPAPVVVEQDEEDPFWS